MTLGEQIRQAREKKNLSQEELANRMNVSRQAISKWENNNSVPQGLNRDLLKQILCLEFTQEKKQDTAEAEPSARTSAASLFRKKYNFLAGFFILGVALLTLFFTLSISFTRDTGSFQWIAFYDYKIEELGGDINTHHLAMDTSQMSCILIQWKGKRPDNIKIFSAPNASATQGEEIQLLLTQHTPTKGDNTILLSAECIKEIKHGYIIFGLDYGDHVILSDVYEVFCDQELLTDYSQPSKPVEFVSASENEWDKYISDIVTRNKLDIMEQISVLIGNAESSRYRLENFQLDVLIGSAKEQDGQKRIDCIFQADWISVRDPEEDPMIQGMYQAMKALTDEDEIIFAQDIIDGWILEMNSWPKEERLPTYLALLFDETDCWSIYFIYIMNGTEELIPLAQYAEKEMTENAEQRLQSGIDNINREIEWFREQKESIFH